MFLTVYKSNNISLKHMIHVTMCENFHFLMFGRKSDKFTIFGKYKTCRNNAITIVLTFIPVIWWRYDVVFISLLRNACLGWIVFEFPRFVMACVDDQKKILVAPPTSVSCNEKKWRLLPTSTRRNFVLLCRSAILFFTLKSNIPKNSSQNDSFF